MVSEYVLLGLLVASNAYWAWNCHRLINKLMSRNYFEFKDATLKSEEKPKTIVVKPEETEDFGSLNEIMN